MTVNLAPLHIYIHTKSYRNFKVRGWAVRRVGGERWSAAVGLSFLLITDRLAENKPGPILPPLWGQLRLQSLLTDFTSFCLPVPSQNNRHAFPFCIFLQCAHANLMTRLGFGQNSFHLAKGSSGFLRAL